MSFRPFASVAIVVVLFENMEFEHPKRLQMMVIIVKNNIMFDIDFLWLSIFLLDKW